MPDLLEPTTTLTQQLDAVAAAVDTTYHAAQVYLSQYDCAADAYDPADARLRCLEARTLRRYGDDLAAAKRSLHGDGSG